MQVCLKCSDGGYSLIVEGDKEDERGEVKYYAFETRFDGISGPRSSKVWSEGTSAVISR